ncbi:MAG TPA: hypothetical protein VM100_12015 [Longimicrobiales bacterium]|nr:hypothetical protein [Longimicrobiales bacterium]
MKRAILSFALVLAACASKSTSTPTPLPDIAGEWSLNRAASDSVRGSRDREIPRRPLIAIGRAAGWPDGGMGPGSMQITNDGDLLEAVRNVWLKRDSRMKIVFTGENVRVEYGDSATYQLPINGQRQPHAFRSFEQVQSIARWHNGTLEMVHYFQRVRVMETFLRTRDRLVVRTRILSAFRPIEFARIYERL